MDPPPPPEPPEPADPAHAELRWEDGRPLLASEVRSITQAVQKAHRNLGHPNNRALRALARRAGARPVVLDIIDRFKCDACLRAARGNLRPIANAHEIAAPLDAVEIDDFEHTHPVNGTKLRGT
eukprot:15454607-Alexandrium_andersonii.AAC.1